NEYLEVTPSPPLGVGNGVVETQMIGVEDGSLFVLYTDGLVESRDRDIQDGVSSDAKRDDIAVLIAKLRRIPEDHRICFQLEPEYTAVRHARSLIRDPLKRWGLEDL